MCVSSRLLLIYFLLMICSDGTSQTFRLAHQHPQGEDLTVDLIFIYSCLIKVIRAAESAHLWSELVFLYIKYDEFVSACTVIP
jgi:hypothetical protein